MVGLNRPEIILQHVFISSTWPLICDRKFRSHCLPSIFGDSKTLKKAQGPGHVHRKSSISLNYCPVQFPLNKQTILIDILGFGYLRWDRGKEKQAVLNSNPGSFP